MLKNVVLGAAALTLLATVAVVAQQRSGNRDFMHRLIAEDRAALVDARVAELHAGLHLSADQERLWSGFELAYRDLATIRSEGSRSDRRRQAAGDPIERAQRASEVLATRSAALKRYADFQQRRFIKLWMTVRSNVSRCCHGSISSRVAATTVITANAADFIAVH